MPKNIVIDSVFQSLQRSMNTFKNDYPIPNTQRLDFIEDTNLEV